MNCSIENCSNQITSTTAKRSGLCFRHRRNRNSEKARGGRKRTYNEAGVLVSPCSYAAAHRRVHRLRGKARDYLCAHGDQIHLAAEWAYNNVSPLEQTGVSAEGYPVRWSPDPADYLPLCKDHHYAYDRIERPAVHKYISTGMTYNGESVIINPNTMTVAIADGSIPPTDAPAWIRDAFCF